MGADFMFSINEMKLTKEEAYAKARKYADNSLEATVTMLVEHCGCYEFDNMYLEGYDITSDQLYEFLTECIDTVYNYQSLRDCSYFTIDYTRRFAITGGMSWGDEPSNSYKSFNVCEVLGLTD